MASLTPKLALPAEFLEEGRDWYLHFMGRSAGAKSEVWEDPGSPPRLLLPFQQVWVMLGRQ